MNQKNSDKSDKKLFCVRSTSVELSLSLLIIVIPTSTSFVRPRSLSNESILQNLTQQHTHIYCKGSVRACSLT